MESRNPSINAPKNSPYSAIVETEERQRAIEIQGDSIRSADYQKRTATQKEFKQRIIAHVTAFLCEPTYVLEDQYLFFGSNVARPDFFFPKHRLVVEIDGSIHNREFQIKIDSFNEEEVYAGLNLDLRVLRFIHDDFYHEASYVRVMKHFTSLLRESIDIKKRNLLKSKISYHRRNIPDAIPKYSWLFSQNKKDINQKNNGCALPKRSWGGLITIIRPKKERNF